MQAHPQSVSCRGARDAMQKTVAAWDSQWSFSWSEFHNTPIAYIRRRLESSSQTLPPFKAGLQAPTYISEAKWEEKAYGRIPKDTFTCSLLRISLAAPGRGCPTWSQGHCQDKASLG